MAKKHQPNQGGAKAHVPDVPEDLKRNSDIPESPRPEAEKADRSGDEGGDAPEDKADEQQDKPEGDEEREEQSEDGSLFVTMSEVKLNEAGGALEVAEKRGARLRGCVIADGVARLHLDNS